jgi:hypothetical protein
LFGTGLMGKCYDRRNEEGYLKEILSYFHNHMESERSIVRHRASARDQGLHSWPFGLDPPFDGLPIEVV